MYPEGARVHFTRYGRPWIGRVISDDPGRQRVKLRIETKADNGPEAYSMITSWVSYRAVGEVVSRG